jgi:hypothetical protein
VRWKTRFAARAKRAAEAAALSRGAPAALELRDEAAGAQ